jgi:hypothetical protein
MGENFDFDAEFRVRLPTSLAERIADVAKKERRSRNLQYVYMLENWFELKDSLENRVKAIEESLENIADDASREKTAQKKKAG